jgi:hypothetical protein
MAYVQLSELNYGTFCYVQVPNIVELLNLEYKWKRIIAIARKCEGEKKHNLVLRCIKY